jgi:hypothetical protein
LTKVTQLLITGVRIQTQKLRDRDRVWSGQGRVQSSACANLKALTPPSLSITLPFSPLSTSRALRSSRNHSSIVT